MSKKKNISVIACRGLLYCCIYGRMLGYLGMSALYMFHDVNSDKSVRHCQQQYCILSLAMLMEHRYQRLRESNLVGMGPHYTIVSQQLIIQLLL